MAVQHTIGFYPKNISNKEAPVKTGAFKLKLTAYEKKVILACKR